MTEVNKALEYGHLQNSRNIRHTLAFWMNLVLQCMENTIVTYTGDIGGPMRTCITTQTVKHNL